jgi:osmotically-inducible protein OsmY
MSTSKVSIHDPHGSSAHDAQGPAPPLERALHRLWSHPHRVLKNLSCAYRDGILTLRGRVPTYYLKQLAQAAVANVEGVVQIDNQIEVSAAGHRWAKSP